MTNSPYIEVANVGKTFNSDRGGLIDALVNASVNIERGEFVSLVGPSGCGKSTLLRIIAGLLPATTGAVTIDGVVIDKPPQELSVVFQSPRLLPWRTIASNVELPLFLGKPSAMSRQERESRVLGSLGLVGLAGFENAYPHELSGGMQQRAAIARALVTDSSVLLMDEPFGALDAFTRESMNDELLSLHRDTGAAVLFVTHDVGEAVFLSDRVIVMSARPGRIVADLPINLPRPRAESTRADGEYFEAVRRVREVLMQGMARA